MLILVVFMLIRREDLRNRVIGLLGHGRLTGTTRVLVESAERLSRFLLTQLTINTGFGLLFGLALLIVGVPYWFLWGFLAVILRFVPFIGSWIAAALPLLLSLIQSPGWSQPLLVLAVFVGLELFAANVAEPLLVGHSTGVSPVALLVAAVFWAWVWGPIGLVLATPLTVCLVVLGQHVPRLKFLSLLLSDQAPLAPHASFYQRLLAGDRAEALSIAESQAKVSGLDHLPDEVLLPALVLARRDRENAGLSAEDEEFIFDSTQSILKDVEATYTKQNLVPATRISTDASSPLVLGLPAHHRSEELTLQMLDLVTRGLPCRVEIIESRALPVEVEAAIEKDRPEMVFVAVLPPGGTVQARYLCRRLRRRFADLKIVVGYFGRVRDFDRLLVRLRAAGASYVVTTLLQSRSQIHALLPANPEPQTMPPAESAAATRPGGRCHLNRFDTLFASPMIKFGLRYIAVPGVILALIVLGLNAWFSLQNLRQLRDKESWVEHTELVLLRLRSAEAAVSEAVAAKSGYQLTNDPEFLARFEEGRGRQNPRYPKSAASLWTILHKQERIKVLQQQTKEEFSVLANEAFTSGAAGFELLGKDRERTDEIER